MREISPLSKWIKFQSKEESSPQINKDPKSYVELETDRSMYRIEFTDDNGDRRRQRETKVVVVELFQ